VCRVWGACLRCATTQSARNAERAARCAAGPAGAGHAVGLDIDIPPLVKKHLIDDFEQVAEGGKLAPLPRNPCVAELMDRYVADVSRGLAACYMPRSPCMADVSRSLAACCMPRSPCVADVNCSLLRAACCAAPAWQM